MPHTSIVNTPTRYLNPCTQPVTSSGDMGQARSPKAEGRSAKAVLARQWFVRSGLLGFRDWGFGLSSALRLRSSALRNRMSHFGFPVASPCVRVAWHRTVDMKTDESSKLPSGQPPSRMVEPQRPTPPPMLMRLVPGLAVFRDYRREWLRADLLAGISVCVVMIPSVIAYAGLMGLSPQHGLYAALVPLLIYPFFGSSRQVIVGPDIAISLLIASAIAPLAGGNPASAAMLAATVAVLSGLLLLLGACVKIGAIADFLSKPVLVGYMTGAALILVASQLDKLFGIQLEHNDFFPRLAELAGKLHEAPVPTLLFGAGLLVVILGLRRVAPKIPPALVVVVTAIAGSRVLGLEG